MGWPHVPECDIKLRRFVLTHVHEHERRSRQRRLRYGTGPIVMAIVSGVTPLTCSTTGLASRSSRTLLRKPGQSLRPVLPTDRISVTWTLENIVEKPSSRGGTQLFVSSVARYKDAQGEVVAINRETIVYQPIR